MATAPATTASSSPPPRTTTPLVELREYTLHPQYAQEYMQATVEAAPLRLAHLPLCFFSLPETGGEQLHVATHVYYFAGGYAERQEKRSALAARPDWKLYIDRIRPFVQSQKSTIWVEAPFIVNQRNSECLGLASLLNSNETSSSPSSSDLNTDGGESILEIRRYQLSFGQGTLHRFLELHQKGVRAKKAALSTTTTTTRTTTTTTLVTVLCSELGPMNQVMEIWRHVGVGSSTVDAILDASREQQRHDSPETLPWSQAMEQMEQEHLVMHYSTSIHKPTSFSPLR
ncbi:hypothetical protein ACA910_018741 [Epithemia clementina (nom. ined.)]